MINEMVEPFKLPALERMAKIVGDSFTGTEITQLFKKSGYSEISHDGGTKWRFLYSTFEKLQKRKFGSYIILKFLETVCDPQEYFERPEYHKTIVSMLNDVLNFYSLKVNEKGKVIKIKEKRDMISTLETKANPKTIHDQTIIRINITPTQGYAGDSIVLEAWASEPDTEIHLDIIDENGIRRINTGQVVFDKPFRYVLTLSKSYFNPGTLSAVFYTTNIKENKTRTFEFLASTPEQKAKPKPEAKPTLEAKPEHIPDNKQWDIFISHATEDKKIASPLANKLQKLGLKVWYDQDVLKWGDSLMDSINSGLKNSLYGIVIFSKTFFKKNWTLTELKTLVSLANATGEKKILPLLYEISHNEISEKYPILSDIVARSWDEGLDSLANEIKKLVESKKTILNEHKKTTSIKNEDTQRNKQVSEFLLKKFKDLGLQMQNLQGLAKSNQMMITQNKEYLKRKNELVDEIEKVVKNPLTVIEPQLKQQIVAALQKSKITPATQALPFKKIVARETKMKENGTPKDWIDWDVKEEFVDNGTDKSLIAITDVIKKISEKLISMPTISDFG